MFIVVALTNNNGTTTTPTNGLSNPECTLMIDSQSSTTGNYIPGMIFYILFIIAIGTFIILFNQSSIYNSYNTRQKSSPSMYRMD